MKYSPEFVGSEFRIPSLRRLRKAVERENGQLPVAVGHLFPDLTVVDRIENGVYAIHEQGDEFGEDTGVTRRFLEGFKEGNKRGGMIVLHAGIVALNAGLFGGVEFEYTRTHIDEGERGLIHDPIEIVGAVDQMDESISRGGIWNGFEQDRLGYSRLHRTITPNYHDGFNGVQHSDVVFDLALLRDAVSTRPVSNSV
jgi:hypothetical protein